MGKEKLEKKRGINEVFGSIAAGIAAVYVLVMLCVFPLYTNDMYFDVLSARFTFYWVGTFLTGLLFVLLFIVYLLIDWKENQGVNSREQLAMLKPGRLVKHLRPTDWCFLALIGIMLISMIGSGYPYETFWGNRGRYQGLLCWLMYAVEYIFITRFYRYKPWHLKAFLFAGMLVCLWGITDFFRLDLFGFLENVGNAQKNTFVSSVGNINTYTNLTAVIFAVSSLQFITDRKAPAFIFDYVVMLISSMACIMGVSDNVVFAYAGFFAAVPFWAWRTRRGILRYLIVLATAVAAIAVTGGVVNAGIDNISLYIGGSFFISLGQSGMLAGAAVLLMLVAVAFLGVNLYQSRKQGSNLLDRETTRAVRIAWSVFCVAGAVAVIAAIVDANTGGHPDFWAPYANAIIFNDDWGTHRGHNWRLAWNYYTESASVFEKLFGHGPDTYYMITMDNYFAEMTRKYGEVYDSAHNEYLNYLMTIGLTGVIAYVSWIVTQIRSMLKTAAKQPAAAACGFALLTYAAQAVINIAIPITLPVVFTVAYMGLAMGREEERSWK